ncbi:MAG: glycosyl hydrolase [Acidimicrobiia bacterium]|nr:glycosyl hydrolase [Acidimicrobiia bacterium]
MIARAALAALVVALVAAGCSRTTAPPQPRAQPGPATRVGPRNPPPDLGAAQLGELPTSSSPPAPAQWAGGERGIPSNQWWSGALVGPGTFTLWSDPLATRIDASGRVAMSAEGVEARADGTSATPFVPALFVEPDAAAGAPAVADYGAFHVELSLGPVERDAAVLTLVRGQAVAELASPAGQVRLLVPGARLLTEDDRGALVATARGDWSIAADRDVRWLVDGDTLEVRVNARSDPASRERPLRLALGPTPAGAPPGWATAVRSVAEQPLVDTTESLAELDSEVVQRLRIERRDGGLSPMVVEGHRQPAGAAQPGAALGTVASSRGPLPVVATNALTTTIAAAPVLWSPLDTAPSSDRSRSADDAALDTVLSELRAGSYFGGKDTYRLAMTAEFAAPGRTDVVIEALRARFERLLAGTDTAVAWEPGWGTLLLLPAEFGSDRELNDHHLQYGYWVAAASMLAEHDRDAAELLTPLVDALVADYAGTAAVPSLAASGLPSLRAWSPYDAHSWSSGTAPFDDGNNIESTSEAAFAWWAAARWFTVTGRADLARGFVARFSLEEAAAARRGLPTAPAPTPQQRPWAGVVWAAKVDLGTWFDPHPEAALGIRLLPLGPQSLARYPDAAAIEAARRRWRWCDDHHGGCVQLWNDLLGSDAVVAGHETPWGGPDEGSTAPGMFDWWERMWTGSAPAPEWRCSAGAVARRLGDGSVVVLASNPSEREVELRCTVGDATGWSQVLGPGERGAFPARS